MTRIAVLAGGCSPEHDISLRSGMQVVKHLDDQRFSIWPVYLDRDGGWWPITRALPKSDPDWHEFRHPTMTTMMSPGSAVDYLQKQGVDLVFPVLHGPNGEDGKVQGMLELHRVPCVGSGCAASAVAMDKIRTREALAANDIPLARAYIPQRPLRHAVGAEEAERVAQTVGFPAFLKVDLSGSTIGVQRVEKPEEVVAFLNEHRGKAGFRRFFAEAAVVGEEITVPVLGNAGETLLPLPPVGIYPRRAGYFTHEEKYREDGASEEIPPRGLSAQQLRRAQELAMHCHEILQCDGMSRTDMIATQQGLVVLEVNTIPGLTEVSLIPKAAKAAGMSFTMMLSHLVDLALARARMP